MKGNVRKFMKEVRRKERIKEAIRARKFSESETIGMGFDLINFAIKFREEITDAFHERHS